jgi:hypothetical protein
MTFFSRKNLKKLVVVCGVLAIPVTSYAVYLRVVGGMDPRLFFVVLAGCVSVMIFALRCQLEKGKG